MTIKSKIHNYGNEHESEWPPQFGTGGSGPMYYCKERKCMVEGYPPNPNPKYGEAPQVIFDSMPPTYHEAAGRIIESRREWELTDKQHNTITFGNVKDAKPLVDKANEEKRIKAERRAASLKALQEYKDNPREVSQRVAKKAEEQNRVLEKAGIKLDNIKNGVIV